MWIYQLKNELWKLFGKKRTYIGFMMLALAQLLIVCLLRFSPSSHHWMERIMQRSGFPVDQYISMLTVATIMASILAYTLLPLYVALIGGDIVSKEAEDGTLRMILSRPVSRARLLCLKWCAGFVFSVVLALALALGGLIICGLFFPVTGGLFAQVPDQDLGVFLFNEGFERFLLAHLFLVIKAATIMSLAFMFSCFNMKPAAAAILALSVFIIDRILEDMPYFHDLRQYFIDYHMNMWQLFFQQHIEWWQIGESVGMLLGFSLTFLIVGVAVFQVRDIKS